jgi:hypothetical protein
MSRDEHTPPPGDVHDLAERAVDFVRRAIGVTLDYTPETLPVLDHWLANAPPKAGRRADSNVPGDDAVAALATTVAGVYFGEVARRSLGGEWDVVGDAPEGWQLTLTGGVTLWPVAFAAAALAGGEVEDIDASFEVPAADRDAVEEALARVEVPEDEYWTLPSRLEALTLVCDLLAARRATDHDAP